MNGAGHWGSSGWPWADDDDDDFVEEGGVD